MTAANNPQIKSPMNTHYHHSHDGLDKFKQDPQGIIEKVCESFGVTRDQLEIRTRKRKIREPRQVAMFFLRVKTSMAYSGIGNLFGGFDHTTVIHAVNSVRNDIETSQEFKDRINAIYTVTPNMMQ